MRSARNYFSVHPLIISSLFMFYFSTTTDMHLGTYFISLPNYLTHYLTHHLMHYHTTYFRIGDEVIRKGTEGNVFYIIKEGTMRVTDVGDGRSYPDHDLGPGDYFGERALLTGEPRAANIKAISSVVLMALDRVSFDTLLGPLKDVLNQNMIIRALNSLKFFDNLSPNMKVRVAKAFEMELFPAGQIRYQSSVCFISPSHSSTYNTPSDSFLPSPPLPSPLSSLLTPFLSSPLLSFFKPPDDVDRI